MKQVELLDKLLALFNKINSRTFVRLFVCPFVGSFVWPIVCFTSGSASRAWPLLEILYFFSPILKSYSLSLSSLEMAYFKSANLTVDYAIEFDEPTQTMSRKREKTRMKAKTRMKLKAESRELKGSREWCRI